jgi:hypothetical protein
VEVPRVALRWRFEKAGYATAERATTAQDDNIGLGRIHVILQEAVAYRTAWFSCPLAASTATLNLGTPPADKRWLALEAGHSSLPRNVVVRESLTWLDKYLGPVTR